MNRCLADYCSCVPDCCSPQGDRIHSFFDDEEWAWFCPEGTTDVAGCTPETCACDQATQFYCVTACCAKHDDALYEAVCVDGEWACPAKATQPYSECLEVVCPCEYYAVLPGDRCDPEGQMYCEMAPDALEWACGAGSGLPTCQTCSGFDPGMTTPEDCRCECAEWDAVVCHADQAG